MFLQSFCSGKDGYNFAFSASMGVNYIDEVE
jgi:hypothetical protein